MLCNSNFGIPPAIELTSHQASVVVAPVVLLAALFVDVGQQGEAVAAQMAAVGQGEAGETLDHVNLPVKKSAVWNQIS